MTLPAGRMKIAIAVSLAALVITGGLYFLSHRGKSEASNIAAVFASRGHSASCAKTGVIAFAGGRSNLYRCSWENTDQYGYATTTSRCAVWVDGSAYDVTKAARASSQLTGDQLGC